ncbi:hypothetical protein H8F21_14330 [Pseudomonas sp. P66]|uniref:Uncharacterized protein n=1 Tax=Pseudomonas arcuscaelestis TaxID=2710591 RepID=A0ABS2BYP2_9PSED|nr:hypothetical protein [Pseudomonas arcuscaelestis]MBM5458741.1 hypothetical protein [Pseudomonas arcuscaelestis]
MSIANIEVNQLVGYVLQSSEEPVRYVIRVIELPSEAAGHAKGIILATSGNDQAHVSNALQFSLNDVVCLLSAEDHGAWVAAVDGWTNITHAGERWSFDADQLDEWDEEEQGFHFLTYHRLSEPTIEAVRRFIDDLHY